jgi:protein-tyrosine phosphatase
MIAELTMSGYVDIHAHLLPGIDDGPDELAGALDMARVAAHSGTEVLAATPHLRADFPAVDVREIAARCQRLQAEIDAAGIKLRIISGAETSLVWALEASSQDLALATFAGRGTDLLVETPHDVSMLDQMLYEVSQRVRRVTLAHPERSRTFQREPDRLTALKEQGILFQVNADALTAGPGSHTRRLAEHLCLAGMVDAMASDGHRAEAWRPVDALSRGFEALRALVGERRASWTAGAAPAAIIRGAALPDPPEIEPARRPLWRRRRH